MAEVDSKAGRTTILQLLSRFRKQGATQVPAADEPPLRAELFSADQMEHHGKALAGMHPLKPGRGRNFLLSRLADNERLLLQVNHLLSTDVHAARPITPAGEWLLDNFYLIEEQIRMARHHLPRSYNRELPYLANGPSVGLPRVYDLALEAVAHGDGRVDPENLARFVAAYQSVSPLKLGELWAIPIMLRLALIENLRRVAARLAASRIDRNRAGDWADHMIEIAKTDPKSLILAIADMARSTRTSASSFVAELARRLQGLGPALALPLSWIEQHLSETGLNIEQVVRVENQGKAANQVSMSNSIRSLRFLSSMNWRDFVESASQVEQILRTDPCDLYRCMDFATRDTYRHVIEAIARRSRRIESEVAHIAIELAQKCARENGPADRASHVGYYLIHTGLAKLEKRVGARFSIDERLRKVGCRIPLMVYGGAILITTIAGAAIFVTQAHADGMQIGLLCLFAFLSLVCASHLAVGMINWISTLLAQPRRLPRMDYAKGIPPAMRTLVVVPTMISSAKNVEELIEALEVRFLANRDSRLHFGLLTDFRDATAESMPEDEGLIALVKRRIDDLNKIYPQSDGAAFYLFHRPRRWNARDRVWMGYERKRGKLADLNGLLRGKANDRFSVIVGDITVLTDVHYVITLDTDTLLPRDTARQLVGIMAHPLNQPRYDEKRRRIVEGYGILQPRMAINLTGVARSWYARLFGSEPGIDPYTRSVSDVYQDLFSEGSFIGKGIYDVDAFERALGGRFPENRILSHDLLEGCYARSGLISDVQLYEEYPSRYDQDVSRRHRWIRGDWQIARWMLPGIPGPNGHLQRNPVSALCRWKIFDNLRRSLIAAALALLLMLGWALLDAPGLWTITVLGLLLLPALSPVAVQVMYKPKDVPLSQHLRTCAQNALQSLILTAFTFACLPYEAYFSLDAILRATWRMVVSRLNLLEWNPSCDSDRPRSSPFIAAWRTMWISPVLAVANAVVLAMIAPSALAVAGPILVLWFAAPLFAWWLSRPMTRTPARLQLEQVMFLRQLARKTWKFFETFVGPEDHWLPPDNFQEHPLPVVAHRTSPTNMGLALLANVSAYDFGYITPARLIDRTAKTLETMGKLERYEGHFYNWYDTQTLKALPPLYISSVDSGNLAGHMLTLRQALLELPEQKIFSPRLYEGLHDTLEILTRAATASPEVCAPAQLVLLRQMLTAAQLDPTVSLSSIRQHVDRLAAAAEVVLHEIAAHDPDPHSFLVKWLQAFSRQCQDIKTELAWLLPWTANQSMNSSSDPFPVLPPLPTLAEIAQLDSTLQSAFAARMQAASPEKISELMELRQQIEQASRQAHARIELLQSLARQCDELAWMEYDFLYDNPSHLLAIGYDVVENRRDPSSYDLLASEARLACFVAIAQGKLPQESWFALGRLLTHAGGEPALLSWSGSMFEYLMPMLVMPSYENTLLDQTSITAVNRQIEYGVARGVPWGISESGYNATDMHLNYQYRAFGVPGMGLKRGLAEDLVIAPYASALALMVAPEAACRNLEWMAAEGFESRFGFYEAIDYTPARLRPGQTSAIVRSFMVHHQGMTLLALTALLCDCPMQKRFVADPSFQASLLLLQERIPRTAGIFAHTTELAEAPSGASEAESPIRVFNSPDTPTPVVQLLSNSNYHVMVTGAGGGYSRWKDLALTRWREDPTCDNWGAFCYLRDVASQERWSTAYQPTLKPSKYFEAIFSEGRAEFRGRDYEIESHTEIAVSPEDDIEVRRIRLTNRTDERRIIEVTSYAEVVLAPPAADALHPAFSNLFIQTEIVSSHQAILCNRRPRSETDAPPWMFHLMAVHDAVCGQVSYETDRMQFIGRGNTVAYPQAMTPKAAVLSNTAGAVLDPIVAIRTRITIEPGASASVNLVTGIGPTRAAALGLVEKYQDRRLADRVFDLAWTHSQVVLRQINATAADAQLYGALAHSVLYANPELRAEAGVLVKNIRGQSGLWGYSISGDLPIVLLQIKDPENFELVRQMVQAHAYWRLKGLSVDLVIWNEEQTGYRQVLHEQIMGLIASSTEASVTDRPGGIFVRAASQIAEEDRILFQSVARVIVTDSRGTLQEQVVGRKAIGPPLPPALVLRLNRIDTPVPAPLPRWDLAYFNGLGGFTPDGREYVITTAPGQRTPAPWANVLANPQFGSVVSESGSACTWVENAHEFRLTPWQNDPVTDDCGEAFYIRDDERGHVWSPSPLPCRGATPYVTRHGFGYSVFEHTERGIRSELWVYVAIDAAVKFSVLKIWNLSDRPRRLSATGYAEWVLGDLRSKTGMHLITEIDPLTDALFARNPYNTEFPGRTAFFDVDDTSRSVTGDRTEFLGRNGTLRSPAALSRTRLSGKVGPALDPCAAIQVGMTLAPGEKRELVFRLGAGQNVGDARNLVKRFRGSAAARSALDRVWEHWKHTLGAVHVETPDMAFNVLANGWLLYQTLACRLWARNATYQSGGAFGFRDQLQDVMALIHARPQVMREHLIRCSAHQFVEGDVQHWWHPPINRGVRTTISDDYLWLPLATCRYVRATGDTGVLNESAPFLQGRPVAAGQHSYYDIPSQADTAADLYTHCMRAIQHGLRFGEHGLPLMGSGDWNDGMDLVGEQGRGESIWLGFFLYEVLKEFSEIARLRGDSAFVERCVQEAATLQRNLETHGWDGAWYRRAYFDDGTPLGSQENPECQIDSIPQSWAVLSGAGNPARARQGMDSVDRRLVRRKESMIQLFDPPFDTSTLKPGYIKGYVPGVRENGGQYTHAAIWAAMAFARLGDNRRAWELFQIINPVNHARTPAEIAIWKVEPYVVAADVYARPPHVGRGGWTWYTGSAAWLYRLMVESLLGLALEVDKLRMNPCLPPHWQGFTMHYRFRDTVYHIVVVQTAGAGHKPCIRVDGQERPDQTIPLVDDRREHQVEIHLTVRDH